MAASLEQITQTFNMFNQAHSGGIPNPAPNMNISEMERQNAEEEKKQSNDEI